MSVLLELRLVNADTLATEPRDSFLEVLMMSSEWFFHRGGPGAPRYGGDPTKHAVDHDTTTFVREVLQNSNDQAREDVDEPVEVRFRFASLRGEDLRRFLEALRWGRLRRHLGAVAATDRGRNFGRLLSRLDRVTGHGSDPNPDSDVDSDPSKTEAEPELRVLVVEDRNTTGLEGSWEDDGSNYAALVRDELYSNKEDDAAGGTYGLGKSVLWTFSSASTVIFNSVVRDGDDSDDGQSDGRPVHRLAADPDDRETGTPGDKERRLIARTKLPTHRLDADGPDYQGAGWLGGVRETEDGRRPESIRGPAVRTVANKLGIERHDPETTGTSAMVVGFRDPTTDGRAALDRLADEFVDTATRYFWPAIHRGDLRVVVETPDETREADPSSHREVQPFVECYDRRFEDDEIDVPGDVATRSIDIDLPDLRDGVPTEDDTSLLLSVRLAGPTTTRENRNCVALFRGAGMVVDYEDESRIAPRDREFHAILAAGEARTDGYSRRPDRDVEQFLRRAEPPTHDEWDSTEQLREEYQRGYKRAIDDAFDGVREALRDILADDIGTADELPDSVHRAFPLHGRGPGHETPDSSEPQFLIDGEATFVGDRWEVRGSITPEVDEHWAATVSLAAVGEDGRTVDPVPIADLRLGGNRTDRQSTDSTAVSRTGDVRDGRHVRATVDDAETGTARIEADSEAGIVEFEGVSELVRSSSLPHGGVGQVRLVIEAEVSEGGIES